MGAGGWGGLRYVKRVGRMDEDISPYSMHSQSKIKICIRIHVQTFPSPLRPSPRNYLSITPSRKVPNRFGIEPLESDISWLLYFLVFCNDFWYPDPPGNPLESPGGLHRKIQKNIACIFCNCLLYFVVFGFWHTNILWCVLEPQPIFFPLFWCPVVDMWAIMFAACSGCIYTFPIMEAFVSKKNIDILPYIVVYCVEVKWMRLGQGELSKPHSTISRRYSNDAQR